MEILIESILEFLKLKNLNTKKIMLAFVLTFIIIFSSIDNSLVFLNKYSSELEVSKYILIFIVLFVLFLAIYLIIEFICFIYKKSIYKIIQVFLNDKKEIKELVKNILCLTQEERNYLKKIYLKSIKEEPCLIFFKENNWPEGLLYYKSKDRCVYKKINSTLIEITNINQENIIEINKDIDVKYWNKILKVDYYIISEKLEFKFIKINTNLEKIIKNDFKIRNKFFIKKEIQIKLKNFL